MLEQVQQTQSNSKEFKAAQETSDLFNSIGLLDPKFEVKDKNKVELFHFEKSKKPQTSVRSNLDNMDHAKKQKTVTFKRI